MVSLAPTGGGVRPHEVIITFHPNLILRSLNAAVIANCDDGIFFDPGGTRNDVVRGITFRCTGSGIDVDAPTSPHERLVFEDNVIESGGAGIAFEGNNANNRVLGNCVACAAGFECLIVDANAPGVL